MVDDTNPHRADSATHSQPPFWNRHMEALHQSARSGVVLDAGMGLTWRDCCPFLTFVVLGKFLLLVDIIGGDLNQIVELSLCHIFSYLLHRRFPRLREMDIPV